MPFNIDPENYNARDTPVCIDFQNSMIGLSATTCVGYVGVKITTPTVVLNDPGEPMHAAILRHLLIHLILVCAFSMLANMTAFAADTSNPTPAHRPPLPEPSWSY